MDVRFIAGFSVITADPATDKRLFAETLGLPLSSPASVGLLIGVSVTPWLREG